MKKLLTLTALVIFATTMAQEQPKGIMVSGKGTVHVVPDQVLIKVRVEHKGDDARKVKRQTDKDVDAILKFLKRKKNINPKQIQTEYLRLDKNYDYNSKTYDYKANQAISIELKNIDDYEEIISGLMDSGINRIDGIQFKSSKKEEYQSKARIAAIKNAKMKAEEYASALGQKVGKAQLISENNRGGAQPVFKTLQMAAPSNDSANRETLAVGEMDITARVNVTFTLYSN